MTKEMVQHQLLSCEGKVEVWLLPDHVPEQQSQSQQGVTDVTAWQNSVLYPYATVYSLLAPALQEGVFLSTIQKNLT